MAMHEEKRYILDVILEKVAQMQDCDVQKPVEGNTERAPRRPWGALPAASCPEPPRWAFRRIRRAARRGQAMVETAIVVPIMMFLILGVLQLAMIQHAKIMTEYAAFCAARAGIVWNADRWMMENAAIIALLPTYEGLIKENDLGNPMQMVTRIVQRALLYQVNRRIPDAVDAITHGTDQIIQQFPQSFQGPASGLRDKIVAIAANYAHHELTDAINGALGNKNRQMVTVDIISPSPSSFSLNHTETDFDDVRKGASWRRATRLSIRVQYLYVMRIPFANWLVHEAWLAQRLGVKLYGAVASPSRNPNGNSAVLYGKAVKLSGGDSLTKDLAALANNAAHPVYMIPLEGTYTMRMQSNPYRVSIMESY